jgi:predicted small integral membrane protein
MAITMDASGTKNWRVLVALTAIGGGLFCALLGSAFTAISWLVSEPHNRELLHSLGGTVLCLTIPLLLIGAFCLDGKTATPKNENNEDDE